MISKINSSNLIGIEGFIVKVEVDITNGIPCFNIVGLPSMEIRESRERVKSALLNSKYNFPSSRIVVNLSPADMKKEGSYFDLPIAIGILRDLINKDDKYLEESVFVGELSLDGILRKIKGVLPIIMGAKSEGIKRIFIPEDNLLEGRLIDGIEIVPIKSLKQCIDYLNDKVEIDKYEDISAYKLGNNNDSFEEDFSEVYGNYFVKRSAEIAAAGNHNILMIGPPGSGKTMIARRIKGILPTIEKEEMLEVSKIYSSVGMIDQDKLFISERPFRAPHHTVTSQSLIGGGYDAKPGEVVLAHRGVLFLDEIAEFNKKMLETLRQPIEDKKVNISRLKYNLEYPCDFLLIGAMNPCPCGYNKSNRECKCRVYEIDRYINRISGPLLDRFDIFIEVNSTLHNEPKGNSGDTSKDIKLRVDAARNIQKHRFQNYNIKTNNDMRQTHLEEFCNLDDDAKKSLDMIYNKYKLSNRSYFKLLKVSRTIADLENKENIESQHIMESFGLRKAYFKYFD